MELYPRIKKWDKLKNKNRRIRRSIVILFALLVLFLIICLGATTISSSRTADPNNPPVPIISHPLDNSTFIYGDPILFDASNSTNDNLSESLSFTWRSNWDGYLGSNDKFVLTRSLLIGEHAITLYLTDGQYNISSSITINILEEDDPVEPEVPNELNDTDDDSLLDPWEIVHFGDLHTSDGTRDSDGDGYSDYQEYLYDTDPTDLDDRPPSSVVPAFHVSDDDDDDDDDNEPVTSSTSSYWWIILGGVAIVVIVFVIIFVIAALVITVIIIIKVMKKK